MNLLAWGPGAWAAGTWAPGAWQADQALPALPLPLYSGGHGRMHGRRKPSLAIGQADLLATGHLAAEARLILRTAAEVHALAQLRAHAEQRLHGTINISAPQSALLGQAGLRLGASAVLDACHGVSAESDQIDIEAIEVLLLLD